MYICARVFSFAYGCNRNILCFAMLVIVMRYDAASLWKMDHLWMSFQHGNPLQVLKYTPHGPPIHELIGPILVARPI